MTDYINSLGLMSGTSVDGIDLSVITTDGENIKQVIHNQHYKYTDEEQQIIKSAFGKNPKPDDLQKATDIITKTHCDIIADFIANNDTKIDVIGFHGQTTFHDPKNGITTQIGDAEYISKKFNTPVVADFRTADVVGGGNGAPLIPIYHQAIAKSKKLDNVCFLNLGGIANITICDGDELIAFDTGMANCLLDDYCQKVMNIQYDDSGNIAKSGAVKTELVNKILSHDFFKADFPKSLDRNEFEIDFNNKKWAELSNNDVLATLNYMTASSIDMGIAQTNKKPSQIIVCGGGSHNKTMLNMINMLTGLAITPISELGFDNDYIESQGFAFLSVRHINKLPSSFKNTTGVSKPTICGKMF